MDDCQVELKKIVAAVDLSKYSEATFLYALTLARALKSELVLLNVINTRYLDSLDMLGGEGLGIKRSDMIARIKQERQETFDKEYLPLAKEVPVKVVFREGLPWEQVIKGVKAEGGSLLVVGAKGRGDMAGVLFGSVADKVQRHCPCPVLSVRGPDHCRLPQ